MLDQATVRTAVFTHLDERGVQRSFNVDALTDIMRRGLAAAPDKLMDIAVEEAHAKFCIKMRGIEQHRLDRITVHAYQTPLIFCSDVSPGTQLLVDGHHRYVKAWQMGWATVPGVLIPRWVWEKCLIVDMPAVTLEELLARPSGIK